MSLVDCLDLLNLSTLLEWRAFYRLLEDETNQRFHIIVENDEIVQVTGIDLPEDMLH